MKTISHMSTSLQTAVTAAQAAGTPEAISLAIDACRDCIHGVDNIYISRLSTADIDTLGTFLRQATQLSVQIAQQIGDKAKGNPYDARTQEIARYGQHIAEHASVDLASFIEKHPAKLAQTAQVDTGVPNLFFNPRLLHQVTAALNDGNPTP